MSILAFLSLKTDRRSYKLLQKLGKNHLWTQTSYVIKRWANNTLKHSCKQWSYILGQRNDKKRHSAQSNTSCLLLHKEATPVNSWPLPAHTHLQSLYSLIGDMLTYCCWLKPWVMMPKNHHSIFEQGPLYGYVFSSA